MKKRVLGLIVEGNSATSAVLRLPRITEEVGPVKSGGLRVARRLSNLLSAGYPVAEYGEMQAAKLVLIRVPDAAVGRVVDELCASDLVFAGTAFVLCESWLASSVLAPLTERGASVATVLGLPSGHPQWFLVEGQISAVRQARRFLEDNEARTAELRAGTKDLYFAADLLASALPMPMLLTAQQALRGTGLSGRHLAAVLEQMVQKLARDFLMGSRVNWGGPLAESTPETAERYLREVRQSRPEIARVLEQQLAWARERMAKAKSRRSV